MCVAGSKRTCVKDELFLSLKAQTVMREIVLNRKDVDALVAHADWCQDQSENIAISYNARKWLQARCDMWLEVADTL